MKSSFLLALAVFKSLFQHVPFQANGATRTGAAQKPITITQLLLEENTTHAHNKIESITLVQPREVKTALHDFAYLSNRRSMMSSVVRCFSFFFLRSLALIDTEMHSKHLKATTILPLPSASVSYRELTAEMSDVGVTSVTIATFESPETREGANKARSIGEPASLTG